MHTALETRKKARTRSKSMGGNNSSPKTTDDHNLNGENVSEKESEDVMEVDKPDAADTKLDSLSNSEESKDEKPTKGRKRKASEMKLNNSILEEPPAKEKPPSNVEKPDEVTEANPEESPNINESPTKIEDVENRSDEAPSNNNTTDSFHEGESFGKGKRARIPNKRYSDFPLKTPTKLNLNENDPQENGEIKENIDSGSNTDASENSGSVTGSPNVATLKLARGLTGISPAAATHKKKSNIDLTNPNYLKPFHFGWKRELVYRATLDGSAGKRNGDIYYYTPNGRKVRSMREVSEHLKNKELTLEDFTFAKEPLGLNDPEKEIIRDAKNKSASGTPLIKKLNTPKIKTPKVTSPKTVVASSSPQDKDKDIKPKEREPRIKNSPRLGGFKIKLTRGSAGKSKLDKKSKDDGDGELEHGTYPPNWSPISTKKQSKAGNLPDGNKPCRPCSIRCQGVSGVIPNLQCRICLCLYHYECVGLSSHCHVQGYVCKNCQLDEDQTQTPSSATTIAPPPLTPINLLKSVTTKSTTLPKLKRIPKPGDVIQPSAVLNQNHEGVISKPELPRLTPRPKFDNVPESSAPSMPQSENKSIVGAVTTWFPSSSTIQVSNTNSVAAPERPQFIEIIGNKKYVVIPKHTVMSVSPPTAAVPSPNKAECDVATESSNNADYNLDSASTGQFSVKIEPDSSPKLYDDKPNDVDTTAIPNGDGGGDGSVEVVEISKDPQIGRQKRAAASAKKKKRYSRSTPAIEEPPAAETMIGSSYLQNVAFGYTTLLYVFQYLKVQDLLRASCVCSMWRDIASHSLLWKTVRMKNSQIHSFAGLADALQAHGTIHLDLRKMLLPNSGNDDIWQEFSREIKKVDSLKKIELCRCPATVVEQLALSNSLLEVINAVTIKCESMSLAPLVFLKHLQELRLKSTSGFSLTSDLTALADLKELKHLSLTSIKDLNKLNIGVIADLRNLESLDLGECADFPKTFGSEILTRLNKLEKLRLEKGQGNCYTFEILDAVKNMPHLEQLELVNFDIKAGFDKALGACTNIKKLLIIPTYISQSATTNHMVLGGVLRLQSNLSHFVWGITLELLRVTELFVDQCEDADKKEKKEKKPMGNGDSIPVLKPVPLLKEGANIDIPPAQDPPQVEILPLPNLQKLLLQSLPTTRVKILKIPFHATWRQSITDTVN